MIFGGRCECRAAIIIRKLLAVEASKRGQSTGGGSPFFSLFNMSPNDAILALIAELQLRIMQLQLEIQKLTPQREKPPAPKEPR